MKRDFDLIRMILSSLEGMPPMQVFRPDSFEGYDKNTVLEHVELLIEAGLIEGKVQRVMGGGGVATISRLTWAGHDFLDASRDEGIWRRAKESILDPARAFTFDVLKEWLKWQIREKLGMTT